MAEEENLLESIRAHPEDSIRRLAYADWLEERGDVRGEYLRLVEESARIQSRLRVLRPQLEPEWLEAVSPPPLRYCRYRHVHCQIPLRMGGTITLMALHQDKTYGGLLAGIPSVETNDHYIAGVLQEAQRYCVPDASPYLIVPPRRNYRQRLGDMEHYLDHIKPRIPEWLPEVRCIGSFENDLSVRDQSGYFSVLTVVWFQDEFAMPILDPALEHLRQLDWPALAADTCY